MRGPLYPALFAVPLAGGEVECRLCAHTCRLSPGQTGLCRVRHNVDGRLLTSSWGRPVALGIEPMEKKYLFHVLPGSRTLSLGTAGCNLACDYCINWRVSQRGVGEADPEVPPEQVVEQALAAQVEAVAFTYTEPTIFLEYAEAVAQEARAAGLAVVAKSNGLMSAAALVRMSGWLDALNVDLKGWRGRPHRQLLGGDVEPVLANLALARKLGLWVEVSTLLVPGFSDGEGDLTQMARFLAAELGPDTPWHLLRFFPHHRMLDHPATAQRSLSAALAIAHEAGLRFVYGKDLAREGALSTRCPACGEIVLERRGFDLVASRLQEGRCAACGQVLPGVFAAGKAADRRTQCRTDRISPPSPTSITSPT